MFLILLLLHYFYSTLAKVLIIVYLVCNCTKDKTLPFVVLGHSYGERCQGRWDCSKEDCDGSKSYVDLDIT